MMNLHATEIVGGARFEFGSNWNNFLSVVDEGRIEEATRSLREMLAASDLRGKTFLDAGSGSGLFSLAARRLGATVRSFDFDPKSVNCTRALKRTYFADDDEWNISEGSILDAAYVGTLGEFDIVYSWGVLHHTGNMWKACEHVSLLVKPGGVLFIAIYNDRGLSSRLWRRIKRLYCSGSAGRFLVKLLCVPEAFLRTLVRSVYYRDNLFARHKRNRGMSIYHDWIDWMGGLPYEFAKVEDVFEFFSARGFELIKLTTTTDLGNNQFIFRRAGNGRLEPAKTG